MLPSCRGQWASAGKGAGGVRTSGAGGGGGARCCAGAAATAGGLGQRIAPTGRCALNNAETCAVCAQSAAVLEGGMLSQLLAPPPGGRCGCARTSRTLRAPMMQKSCTRAERRTLLGSMETYCPISVAAVRPVGDDLQRQHRPHRRHGHQSLPAAWGPPPPPAGGSLLTETCLWAATALHSGCSVPGRESHNAWVRSLSPGAGARSLLLRVPHVRGIHNPRSSGLPCSMDDAAILDVGHAPDGDVVQVSPQDGAVPDGRLHTGGGAVGWALQARPRRPPRVIWEQQPQPAPRSQRAALATAAGRSLDGGRWVRRVQADAGSRHAARRGQRASRAGAPDPQCPRPPPPRRWGRPRRSLLRAASCCLVLSDASGA